MAGAHGVSDHHDGTVLGAARAMGDVYFTNPDLATLGINASCGQPGLGTHAEDGVALVAL